MRGRAALGCLAIVAGADYVIKRVRPRWIVTGPFDHAAHVATAGLVLLNLRDRPGQWQAGFLAGSLLPDVDHVPLALRPVHLHPSADDPRPLSHCLLAVVPVAAAAAARRSEALAGVSAGMLAHFARDLGVGTGVPLLWPATAWSVRVPYPVYAAACVLLGWRAVRRRPEPNGANLADGL